MMSSGPHQCHVIIIYVINIKTIMQTNHMDHVLRMMSSCVMSLFIMIVHLIMHVIIMNYER